ncbi:hypothetical protein BGW80DRAFT_1280987, partial [Lactifluus volemus]
NHGRLRNTAGTTTLVAQEEARLRQLHPTPEDIPTCMTVFDDFLSCNILATQVKSLYRFGEMAHCSEKWNEFKFCMTWIRRRAEWWARRRLGLCSENVWEKRAEPLKGYPPPLPPQDTIGSLVN